MLVLLSHIIAFVTLSVGAIYDLKTTEVPDIVSLAGVIAGISLHGLHSFFTGSIDPVLWSLSVGIVFSLYGWGSYYLGVWGGADAFAMSVLGFAAPYSLQGFGIIHPVNLFVNMMLIGFVYTLGFSVYQAWKSGTVLEDTYSRIIEDERRISMEILAAAALSSVIHVFTVLNGLIYFAGLTVLIFLYRFLKVLEDDEMSKTIPVSALEEGQVVEAEGVGRTIKGISQEEIDDLEVEEVRVKTGVRFIPVFPVALLITDLFGAGIILISSIFSL